MAAGYSTALVVRPLGHTGSQVELNARRFSPSRSLLVLTLIAMLVSPTVLPIIIEIGDAKIRATELLFMALWFMLLCSRRTPAARFGFTAGIRKAVWIPGAFLVSAAALVILGQDLTSVSVVSASAIVAALRYVEYFLMAPTVVLLCVSEVRAREVAGGLRLALVAVVLVDTLELIVFNPGTAYVRVGFLVNSNTLGLLACGLIVLSVLEPYWLGTRSRSSIVYVAIGIWGLYVAHSMAGILALLSASCFLPGTTRARWITTALVFVAAIAAWRYGDVVGLLDGSGGTLAHREAMAYAGWHLFLDAPVLGVGWQQSTAWLLQSPDVLASAMSRFGQLPSDYFTTRGNLGVHNAYIQLLAEMGLVGTFVVVSALVAMLRRVRGRSPLPWLPLLVAILVWHNTNPIFGGLPETALLWFTYGLAEATGSSSSRARAANRGKLLARTLQRSRVEET